MTVLAHRSARTSLGTLHAMLARQVARYVRRGSAIPWCPSESSKLEPMWSRHKRAALMIHHSSLSVVVHPVGCRKRRWVSRARVGISVPPVGRDSAQPHAVACRACFAASPVKASQAALTASCNAHHAFLLTAHISLIGCSKPRLLIANTVASHGP